MAIIQLQNLAKRYGQTAILRDIDVTFEAGNFSVIYGVPSSGKSVLVRLLTGLEKPDHGQILLRGQDVTTLSPGERNIGYVPQSFALYPHMSVYKNIAYPLSLARVDRDEIREAVERTAALLGIEELLDRKPDQLSGGQKQRVAIARGLVKQTEVFVLDDPLVGLDFKLRERLIDDLRETQETLGVTFIYTTSDAVETMMLANEIAVLHEGEIVEIGGPADLYNQPQRAATMRYIGFPQANFLDGSVTAQRIVDTGIFQIETPFSMEGVGGSLPEKIRVGVRPEHVKLADEAPDGMIIGQAKVLLREDLGGEEIIYLYTPQGTLTSVLRSDDASQQHVEIDQTITFWIDPANIIIYGDGLRLTEGDHHA